MSPPVNSTKQTVAVLGASNKHNRHSNMAIRLLLKGDYPVIPVHPGLKEIEGLQVVPNLTDIQEAIQTLTVYVGPLRLRTIVDEIVALCPERVILNPGTEDDEVESLLRANGIPFLKACTLVMLQSDQF